MYNEICRLTISVQQINLSKQKCKMYCENNKRTHLGKTFNR